jgi:hypothetical protein
MNGLFGVNTPAKLFARLARDMTAFLKHPSEDGIFEIIFPLYHLREWICPDGHDTYKNMPEDKRTREQKLHAKLYGMPEYQVVRDLCNNAKHFETQSAIKETSVLKGLRAGLGRAGDSLGVVHFIVDGKEIRDCVVPVYEVYCSYFSETYHSFQRTACDGR